jgi:hypothetical protein
MRILPAARHVFISSARNDTAQADEIERHLLQHHFPVWRDKRDFAAAK